MDATCTAGLPQGMDAGGTNKDQGSPPWPMSVVMPEIASEVEAVSALVTLATT